MWTSLQGLFRRFHPIAVMAQLLFALACAAILHWSMGAGFVPSILAALFITPVYGILCRSSRYLVLVSPLFGGRVAESLSSLGGASLVAGGLFAGAVFLAAGFLGQIDVSLSEMPTAWGLGVAGYLLTAAYYYATLAREEAGRAREAALRSEDLAREARLAAVLATVNPHFLFNSLNAVASLTVKDPPGARRMALELADYLRYRMGAQNRLLVPLREELQATRWYLDIESVRFSDRLRVEWKIPEELDAVMLPPFVLQPLAENALKHGIALIEEGGTITLEVRRRGALVEISVCNPAPRSVSSPGAGRGLSTVRERLALTYGGAGSLVTSCADGAFLATVSIPTSEASR